MIIPCKSIYINYERTKENYSLTKYQEQILAIRYIQYFDCLECREIQDSFVY